MSLGINVTAKKVKVLKYNFFFQFRIPPGLYMIGYGIGKIILKFPPFFRLNEKNQEREIQNQMKTKRFLFLFSFDVLNLPALDFPHSI